jgi:hypothetical protein
MMESDEFLIAFAKVASELYAECEMFSAGLQATADANTVIEILLLTAEENERNSKNKDSKKKDSDD